MAVGGKGVGGSGVSRGVFAVGGSGVQRVTLPTDVPNLALWMDNADRSTITLNGSDVSEQRDKSGNDNTATQSTAVNQPVYTATELRLPAIDFNETSHALSVAAAPSINDLWDGGGYYIGVVRKDGVGGGSFGRVMVKANSGETTGWGLLCDATTLIFLHTFSTTLGQWAVTSNPSAPFILEVEYNSGATTNDPVIRVNGAAPAVTESSTPVGTRASDASDALTIGNRLALGRNWDGPHGEHCLFSTIPGASQKAALRSYLAAKWGVAL